MNKKIGSIEPIFSDTRGWQCHSVKKLCHSETSSQTGRGNLQRMVTAEIATPVTRSLVRNDANLMFINLQKQRFLSKQDRDFSGL